MQLMTMAWQTVLWLGAAYSVHLFPAEPLVQVATLVTQ